MPGELQTLTPDYLQPVGKRVATADAGRRVTGDLHVDEHAAGTFVLMAELPATLVQRYVLSATFVKSSVLPATFV